MAFLIDTDVLIDYLRNLPEAASVVERNLNAGHLSTITVAELYQGIRDGKERAKLEETLSVFTLLPVTSEIAERGGLLSREFRKSHGCGLADCLVAATAGLYSLNLLTLNAKHYPMLKGLETPYRKKSP